MDRGVVFQDFAQLFPWRTALGNVAFGLEMKGMAKAEREAIALQQLRLVKLEKFAQSYPHHLSGGMQQRVAIARALAYNPAVLLMDEPFAALDALTRDAMQQLLAEVWRETRKTVIYVTHNVAEAVYLADRVIVMTPHPGTVKTEVPIALDAAARSAERGISGLSEAPAAPSWTGDSSVTCSIRSFPRSGNPSHASIVHWVPAFAGTSGRGACCRASALAGATAADAQSYATRPVRLVVGFGAGGPTDIPARFIADKLGTILKQRVVVENKPGAAGMLATRDAISQPADGHTLLLCTHFESINTAVYRNPQFKLEQLAPISLIAKYYYGIAMTNALPANDIDGFIAHAKANPGAISYATLGRGSAQEIFVRQLERLAGISLNRVPVPHRPADHAGPDRGTRAHLRLADARGAAAARQQGAQGDRRSRAPSGSRTRRTFRRSPSGRFRSSVSAGSASARAKERRSRSSAS